LNAGHSMDQHINHHFVPQFYFRNFSADGKRIALFHLKSGVIVPSASIRRQATRKKLYVNDELEAKISHLESDFSRSFRDVIEAAREDDYREIQEKDTFSKLRTAMLFQRYRTPGYAESSNPAYERMMLKMFRAHIERGADEDFRGRALEAIDKGDVNLELNPQATVLRGISMALEFSMLISDLEVCVLKNVTRFPFIFGDWPVVLVNTFCRNVKNRGVLGLQCHGLQIFCPLSPDVAVMLFDPNAYYGPCIERIAIEVVDPFEVSQLNALQLCLAHEVAYFGDCAHGDYVSRLWNVHQHRIGKGKSEYRQYSRVDGGEETFMHIFDPQPEIIPEFSFIRCDPLREHDYAFSRRNPTLFEEWKAIAIEYGSDVADHIGTDSNESERESVLFRDVIGREMIVDLDSEA
jgi:hypothetical protein